MTSPELPPLPCLSREGEMVTDDGRYIPTINGDDVDAYVAASQARERILQARIAELEADAERLNYIERTFAGCTTQDRYLPIRMIWGKGCNGRTLREACDKYMARDAARSAE